jgi:hypothetical protein
MTSLELAKNVGLVPIPVKMEVSNNETNWIIADVTEFQSGSYYPWRANGTGYAFARMISEGNRGQA